MFNTIAQAWFESKLFPESLDVGKRDTCIQLKVTFNLN